MDWLGRLQQQHMCIRKKVAKLLRKILQYTECLAATEIATFIGKNPLT